ncbi:hypothetical protein E4U50_003002 [Claviceps purpurea]|nr:hypothetical protein E4U28_003077 [Claviceps purpurea]KAG6167055.1 hypothetical protein E4U11_007581 [Claviceps purpurea]KAG6217743.1 hypothetical protein E4U50_003002 [Claviceps purpurea]
MSATEEQTMSRGDERDARNRARVSSEAWCRGRDASTSFLRSSQESKEPGSPEAPMKQRRDGKLQRAAKYGCKARIRRGGFARVCRLREQENKSAWDRSGSQTWSWPEMVKEGACELKTGLRTGGGGGSVRMFGGFAHCQSGANLSNKPMAATIMGTERASSGSAWALRATGSCSPAA